MRSTEQTEILIGAKLICIALGLYEGGKLYFRETWIACFIPHELSVLSPWFLFLVKRDFGNSRELWFLIRIICETRIGCLVQCELWFSFMLFLIFRGKKLKIQLFRLKQISSLNQWRLLWWQWFFIRRKWCWASTSKHTTQFPFHSTKNKKLENGEDIEQGSSLAVVLNQSKKNWSYKNLFFAWNAKCRIYCPRNVKRSFYFLYVITTFITLLYDHQNLVDQRWINVTFKKRSGYPGNRRKKPESIKDHIIPTTSRFKQGNFSWE